MYSNADPECLEKRCTNPECDFCSYRSAGIPPMEVGGRPESCGYLWDKVSNTWIRPWSGEFIDPKDKPEWDKFISTSTT